MKLRSKLIIAFTMVACVPLVGGAIGIFSHQWSIRRAAELKGTEQKVLELTEAVQSLRTQTAPSGATKASGSMESVRRMAAELGLATPALDGADRQAVTAWAATVPALAAGKVRELSEAVARENRWLDLTMGFGTLA